jgi:hypothetical protein
VRYLGELMRQFEDEGYAEDVPAERDRVNRVNDEIGATTDARMAERFGRLMQE